MSKSKIEDRFICDKNVYETEMYPLSIHDLRLYCKLFKLEIKTYYLRGEPQRYIVPGRYILDWIPATLAKLYNEKTGFPLHIMHHMTPSVVSTEENPIFVGDELVFKIQTWCEKDYASKIFVGARIQIYREKEIVFTGQFDFTEFK